MTFKRLSDWCEIWWSYRIAMNLVHFKCNPLDSYYIQTLLTICVNLTRVRLRSPRVLWGAKCDLSISRSSFRRGLLRFHGRCSLITNIEEDLEVQRWNEFVPGLKLKLSNVRERQVHSDLLTIFEKCPTDRSRLIGLVNVCKQFEQCLTLFLTIL